MEARGLSFWNLPSAVIFSHNQNLIVTDIYRGRADVGMVRGRARVCVLLEDASRTRHTRTVLRALRARGMRSHSRARWLTHAPRMHSHR
jgi:hypothetical protein